MAVQPAATAPSARVLLAGDLVYSRLAVASTAPVRDVAALFRAQPETEAIAVVDDGLPVGLIVGHKLTASLSQQYGFSLYGHRPIAKLANAEPLIVRAHEPLSAVVDQVLAREKDTVFDDAIVVGADGLFQGLLSVRSAMVEQNTAFATAVAERKLATERAAQLERIGRMKTQFIAHVSHELRAPVNVMIGVLDLLGRELADSGGAKTHELLAIASASGAGLRRLIANILDLSKLEAGKLTAEKRRFDPLPLLRAVVQETEILLGPKRQTVNVELCVVGEPRHMLSDDIKLRQLLTNLAGNAAKFTERGEIRLVAEFAATGARFAVRDSGIGIAPGQLERMFEPFVQADDPKSRRFDGTGLGLSIAKLLSGLLGGTISASSSLNHGSEFSIEIPLELPDPGGEHHDQPEKTHLTH